MRSHDTTSPYGFVLGSGVTSQKSLLIKHSASLPPSIKHLWDTAKPLDQDGSAWVKSICPSSWTTQRQSAAVVCVYNPPEGIVWCPTVHITEIIPMLNDCLQSLKYTVIVTHSVGGLRSSDLVSKKLRTSSLWEMWGGSFIKAFGKEGRQKVTGCSNNAFKKFCVFF